MAKLISRTRAVASPTRVIARVRRPVVAGPVDVATLRRPLLVVYYLMASYLYYIKDVPPPMSDSDFDKLCERLNKEWRLVEHRHKHIVDKGSLTSGTGFYIREDEYPLIVRGAAMHWLNTTGG